MELRLHRAVTVAFEAARENLGVKLISLALSIAIFSYFRGAGVVTRSLDLPVNVLLPSTNEGASVLLTPLPESVRMTVRGLPSVVGALRPESIGQIQLDLREGQRARVRFNPNASRLPPGVTLLGVSPDALDLRWDHFATRLVPVHVPVIGTPAAGTHLVEPLEIVPASVRVRGPATLLEPLNALQTEPMDLAGLVQGHHERGASLLDPPERVTYERTSVRVRFEVAAIVAERRFPLIPVTATGVTRVQLRPATVDVLVRGDPAAVEALQSSQIVPVVSLDPAALRSPLATPVHMQGLPPGIRSVVVSPDEVIALPSR